MRLSKEEYREAKKYLKRYNYNCIKIQNIRADIMSFGSANLDDIPKSKYSISNRVLDSVIKLQEDENLQQAIKECKIVRQALELVNKDSRYIFEKQYQLGQTKWDIINSGMSEGTYKRRHSDLVYSVYKELKKVRQN